MLTTRELREWLYDNNILIDGDKVSDLHTLLVVERPSSSEIFRWGYANGCMFTEEQVNGVRTLAELSTVSFVISMDHIKWSRVVVTAPPTIRWNACPSGERIVLQQRVDIPTYGRINEEVWVDVPTVVVGERGIL
jgi:hypothetical protein